jgi:hypothetical protein
MDIKGPGVSVILASPSYSTNLRKGSWNNRVYSVPGDASEGIETKKHPKTLLCFADVLGLNLTLLMPWLLEILKPSENSSRVSQHR